MYSAEYLIFDVNIVSNFVYEKLYYINNGSLKAFS